ncbi:MAG: Xaa-Pro aminopeptidase [Euryarchaeota archaeon]|nr:Xaa-Pro aminopeptidase [Euryarchaeota archaeon]
MSDGPVFPLPEYLRRQSALLSQLDIHSILLIPTNDMKIRSNDVHFPFRASSDILYLTGWDEPKALFVGHHDGEEWKTTLFVRDNNELAERWEGRRVGVSGAQERWPVDNARDWESRLDALEGWIQTKSTVYIQQGHDQDLDTLVNRLVTTKTRERTVSGKGPISIVDPSPLLAELRIRKSESEISIMREAAIIASNAHTHAMRNTKGESNESEIQSLIESTFMKNHSVPSYGSIVAGGDNATILHYHANRDVVEDGSLILIDAGCEVQGYASDITRTWPVGGKFSQVQRDLYEIVLTAQIEAIEMCRPGNTWSDPHKAAVRSLSKGLVEIGVLDCSIEEAIGKNYDGRVREFFMHGTSHSIGLDVHDVGVIKPNGDDDGRLLEPGMVLTVEPGLYFPEWVETLNIDPKFAGIGIRIEDDVLITDGDPEVLTASCPKTVVDIENTVGKDV